MFETHPSCYLSVKIKRCEKAARVASFLEQGGIRVNNPCRITPLETSHDLIPNSVAGACVRMMNDSKCTVLVAGDGTDFGHDCSWELGYTFASGKRIYLFVDEATSGTAWLNLVNMPDGGSLADFVIQRENVYDNLEFLAQAILNQEVA